MQMQAAEKKRPKEEKDILHRLRPFARLQTAEDYEVFSTDMLCMSIDILTRFATDLFQLDESILRKKIQDLQHYRRMGLTTAADIDKYENDVVKRVCPAIIALSFVVSKVTSPIFLQTQAKANMSRDYYSSERLSQLRAAGGRQSSVTDSRRAHSLAGESEARKSHERELSPKPHTGGMSASAIRKPRTYPNFQLSRTQF